MSSNFQVSLTDQLPKVICEECAFKLDQLFDFREKCLHTEGMFMEMLKEIGKEGVVHISEHDLAGVNNMGTIQRNLSSIQMNGEDVQSHSTVVHEAAESTIHTMQVIDEMDLAGGEQVVSQEEIGQQDADIQVTGIDCLDGDTVRMVDQHIREVIKRMCILWIRKNVQAVNSTNVLLIYIRIINLFIILYILLHT
jgi:hypothetical protein